MNTKKEHEEMRDAEEMDAEEMRDSEEREKRRCMEMKVDDKEMRDAEEGMNNGRI